MERSCSCMAHSSWKNASEGNVRHKSVSMYDIVSAFPNAFSSSRLLSTTSASFPSASPPPSSGGVAALSVFSGRLFRFFALKRLARSLNDLVQVSVDHQRVADGDRPHLPADLGRHAVACVPVSRAPQRILGSDQRGRIVFVHSVAASSIAFSLLAFRFVSSALTRSSLWRRFSSSSATDLGLLGCAVELTQVGGCHGIEGRGLSDVSHQPCPSPSSHWNDDALEGERQRTDKARTSRTSSKEEAGQHRRGRG